MCFKRFFDLVLVEAFTKKFDRFLLRLKPNISFASIIGRVPLVRSSNSQFCLMIAAIGGFLGLCVVIQ